MLSVSAYYMYMGQIIETSTVTNLDHSMTQYGWLGMTNLAHSNRLHLQRKILHFHFQTAHVKDHNINVTVACVIHKLVRSAIVGCTM